MFDFSSIMGALPKLQEMGDKISQDFAALVAEQKAQRELLEVIAEKVGVKKED